MSNLLPAFAVFICLTLQSCKQGEDKPGNPAAAVQPGHYVIDESLEKIIKKSDPGEFATLDARWLQDGKEMENEFMSGKKMPHYVWYHSDNDTIRIDLWHVLVPAGIRMSLYKDSVWAYHFVSTRDQDIRNYKTKPDQALYEYSPNAPAKSIRLVLAKKPVVGEPIEGYVDFESVEFYQKADSTDIKRTYDLKGYFRAKKFM